MNCEQMNELLSAWLDGELSPAQEQQMQAHLEQCAQCRALFEQLQALHTSFADLEDIPAPEGFTQRVMARVEKESKPKVVPLFQRPQVRSFAALAACAVLFVGFGRIVLDGGLLGRTEESAAPESASFAADCAPEPESAAVEYSVESPAEAAPEMPETESAVSEPAAPAPEMTVVPPQGETRLDGAKIAVDGARGGVGEIILRQLPDGLEEELGQLAWEERVEDGARCARLTAEQVQLLMELVNNQGLDAEETVPEAGAEEGWMLVWLPN